MKVFHFNHQKEKKKKKIIIADRFEKLQALQPKCGIHVEHITEVKKSEENSKKKYDKKYYFSVFFHSDALIFFSKRKSKTPTDKPNSKAKG